MSGFEMQGSEGLLNEEGEVLWSFYLSVAKRYGFQKPTGNRETKRFRDFRKYFKDLRSGSFWDKYALAPDWVSRNGIPMQSADPMSSEEVRNKITISCRRYHKAMQELDYQFPGYRPEKSISLTDFIYTRHPESRSLMRYFFFQVPDRVGAGSLKEAKDSYLDRIKDLPRPLPDGSVSRNQAYKYFFSEDHWNIMSAKQRTRFWLNLRSLTDFYLQEGKQLWRFNRNNQEVVSSLTGFLGLVREAVFSKGLTNIPFPSEDNGWWDSMVHFTLQNYQLALPLSRDGWREKRFKDLRVRSRRITHS